MYNTGVAIPSFSSQEINDTINISFVFSAFMYAAELHKLYIHILMHLYYICTYIIYYYIV